MNEHTFGTDKATSLLGCCGILAGQQLELLSGKKYLYELQYLFQQIT